eukprot:g1723.t1
MKKLGKCPIIALEAGAELNLSLRVGTHVRIVCNQYVKQGVVQGMCGIVKSFIYDKVVKLKVPVVQFSKLHPFEPSALSNTNDHENTKKNKYGSTRINSDIVTINVLPYTWSIGSMNKGKYAIFKAIPLIVAYVPDMDIYSNSLNLTFGFEPSMAEYYIPSISNLRCFKAIVAYLNGGFKTLPDDNDVRKTILKDARALNLILMAKHLEQVEDLYDMEPFSKYGEPEYLPPDIICAPPSSSENLKSRIATSSSWYLNVVGPCNVEKQCILEKAAKDFAKPTEAAPKAVCFTVNFNNLGPQDEYLKPIFGGKYENHFDTVLKMGKYIDFPYDTEPNKVKRFFEDRKEIKECIKSYSNNYKKVDTLLTNFLYDELGVRTTNYSSLIGDQSYENSLMNYDYCIPAP